MTTEELTAIRERANRATPGPWADLAKVYHQRMEAHRKRTGRWYHGDRRWSLPITLIARAVCPRSEWATSAGQPGHDLDPLCIPEHTDWHDLKPVIGLRWGSLRARATSATEGFFRPEDADFIAHAREDIPRLLDTVDALRAKLREMEQEERDG